MFYFHKYNMKFDYLSYLFFRVFDNQNIMFTSQFMVSPSIGNPNS